MTDTMDMVKADFPTGVRQVAMLELKALGIRYLLVNEGDFIYTDLKQYPTVWGVHQLAKRYETHFYRID